VLTGCSHARFSLVYSTTLLVNSVEKLNGSEKWIGKDLEGSGCDLAEATIPTFS
jgi:hypothetical protein